MNHGGKYTDLAIHIQKLLETRLGSGTAISFALVQEGEVVIAACAGTRDGDPAHPADLGDLYGIGSLSKIYCTMAVMKLCELGKADLDTPVYTYLPEFTMKDERYKEITLRMCLNHSCGLPGTMFRDFYTDQFLDQQAFYEEFFQYLSGLELKAAPGTNSVYCNDGFELAEAVVARLAGMPFIAFVQEYITGPLGLRSTCSYEQVPAGKSYVKKKGSPGECLMYVGAGGMYTDMSDCARFGWEFIEPGKVFRAESVRETRKPQKLTYAEEEQGADFGLGWDSVRFQVPGADLGEGMLIKTGGSYSFSSYLAVNPAYRMSLAISATSDSDANTMGVLFEIVSQLMAASGGLAAGVDSPAAAPLEPVPLPDGYAEQFAGIYYSDSEQFRVSFPAERLRIEKKTAGGWADMEKELPFYGVDFGYPGADYTFARNGSVAYLKNRLSDKFASIAEKPAGLPPVNKAWLARSGKKYLLENAGIHDLGASAIAASAEIVADPSSGLVSLVTRGYDAAYSIQPALATGDDTTRMFLTAPTMGSRNQYPFRVSREDGGEHLSWCGYSFVDAATLPELERGSVALMPGDCRPYRIREKIAFGPLPDFVRVILLNEALDVVSDSRIDGPPEEAGPGFAILLSAGKGEATLC
ncbi:MAG: beta-lactamase family protein [Clostridia bacterium]|nr:beta-lactamase family protein [Clostridia bacterium]